MQELEELHADLGMVVVVLADHQHRALKDGLKDARDCWHHGLLELVDDGRQQAKHLGLARLGNVGRVVQQHDVEHRRNELLMQQHHVLGLERKDREEPQRLLLDRAPATNDCRAGHSRSSACDRLRDGVAVESVHLQQIAKESAKLR